MQKIPPFTVHTGSNQERQKTFKDLGPIDKVPTAPLVTTVRKTFPLGHRPGPCDLYM